MSSSGNYPDWSLFSERDEVVEYKLLSPASEIAAALQECHEQAERTRRRVEDEKRELLDALALQAVLVTQLASALERYEGDLNNASLDNIHTHLRVAKDQMLDALWQTGIKTEIPLGRTFEEVADLVQVDGWRHQDRFASESVDEVIEPIVSYRDAVIRLGRVIMGAPPDAAEEHRNA